MAGWVVAKNAPAVVALPDKVGVRRSDVSAMVHCVLKYGWCGHCGLNRIPAMHPTHQKYGAHTRMVDIGIILGEVAILQ